jgi:hypothetical protein
LLISKFKPPIKKKNKICKKKIWNSIKKKIWDYKKIIKLLYTLKAKDSFKKKDYYLNKKSMPEKFNSTISIIKKRANQPTLVLVKVVNY